MSASTCVQIFKTKEHMRKYSTSLPINWNNMHNKMLNYRTFPLITICKVRNANHQFEKKDSFFLPSEMTDSSCHALSCLKNVSASCHLLYL